MKKQQVKLKELKVSSFITAGKAHVTGGREVDTSEITLPTDPTSTCTEKTCTETCIPACIIW